MKQHRSVFSLMVHSALVPVLLVILGMIAAETVAFWLAFGQGAVPLEVVWSHSRISWIFSVALVVLTLVLCRMGCRGSSNPRYTLERLSISRKACFGWQALANGLFILLFWAVQTLTAILLCFAFQQKAAAPFVTHQSVFLAFFRSPFLHTLLPFQDWLVWLSNGVTLLALAICSARFPLAQQNGHKFQETYLVLLVAVLTRNHGIHQLSPCVLTVLVCAALILFALHQVFFWEEEPNEKG